MSLEESFSWRIERNKATDVEEAYVDIRALHSIGNHAHFREEKKQSATTANYTPQKDFCNIVNFHIS